MSARRYFAADYIEARRKFCDAATIAGARLRSIINGSVKGPAEEELSTDLAWRGPAAASRVLVTISGTHGAEGFCGSGIQTGTFAGAPMELPPDTALLAIHAINPYGFAWTRRVTEDNVDLNRNFVDHGKNLPPNEGYVELADAICPAEWSEAGQQAALARLADYAKRHGAPALQKAVTAGQYTHKDGVFFGGNGATWSRRTALRVAAEHLAHARRIAIIDYHTGLGPYGRGEKIVIHRQGSAALERARQWYGDGITSTSLGTSASSDVVGDMLSGLEHALARVEVTGMALEYGVRSLKETLDAVRADNWLHHHGVIDSPQGRAIKAQLRGVFYGDADDWKDMILEQGIDAQRRALRGLAG